MNLRRKPKDEAEVSTESLNDIMFFLLLFFLIISTLANPNVIKLLLPKSANNEHAIKAPVNLSMTKEHQYFIDQQPIPFEQLEGAISSAVNGMAEPTIILNFDKDLSVQDLVDVMQIGAKLKVKMVLGTKKST